MFCIVLYTKQIYAEKTPVTDFKIEEKRKLYSG